MRFLGRSLMGVLLVSLTLALLAWGGQIVVSAVRTKAEQAEWQQPARERAFSANVIEVVAGEQTPVFTAFGEVRSRRTLDIRAKSSGSVVFMDEAFEEGGRVEQGQLLLKIDPADAEDALRRVEADILEATSEIRDAERALDLAREDLAAAQLQADLREAALTRQQDLRERGVGTDATVEVAALAAASANQAIVSRRQAIAQAEARLDQANTALVRQDIEKKEAERRLAETEIRAEFAGTLSSVNLVAGGLVTTNEQIAQLVDPTMLEVAFRVSTGQYVRLLDDNGQLIGADVRISLNVLDLDLKSGGKITRESGSVASGQTGRLLFASIDDASGFRPGDFVSISADEPPLSNVARVPSLAVNAASEVLLVGEDDRLETVKVEVLRRQGDDILIRAENLYGKNIVAERSPLLGAGIKVNPITPQSEQPDQTASSQAEPPDEMVELTQERRDKLIAFVEGNTRMPADARERMLSLLKEPKVPAQAVERIESRMGG
ncbi:efflux RND transporter periplasmic adaptor subunit [Falsihalocynthiibacter sp. SS001]|uniref:efflux RND transporter periplasmic adaptor subunit n=1 Tax=Falsihalocynthiibacter sp. SS001 TaxID=3349698 RepID=UPI0036D42631